MRTSGVRWPATSRLMLSPAPDGLALIQDFLNTRSGPWGPDLFADVHAARAWSRRAALAWSLLCGVEVPAPDLVDEDAGELVIVRDALAAVVRHEFWAGPERSVGAAVLAIAGDGTVRWLPDGTGWRWWSAAVWNEVLLNRRAGTFQRLKQCPNDTCRAAFYDRSWDQRLIWHSTACVYSGADRLANSTGRCDFA